MNRERLFRRDDAGVFDWQPIARELAIDGETARLYYEIALHTAGGDVERAESLYRRQLRVLAEARTTNAAAATPGRSTRAIREASPGKYWTAEELAQLPIGKFTRLQIETTRQDRFPGYDDWLASMASLSASVRAASAERPASTLDESPARTSEAAAVAKHATREPAAEDLAHLRSDQGESAAEPRLADFAVSPAVSERAPDGTLPAFARMSPFARKSMRREPAPSTASVSAAVPAATALRQQLDAAAAAGYRAAQAPRLGGSPEPDDSLRHQAAQAPKLQDALQSMIDRAGLAVSSDHLDALTRLYGSSLSWTQRLVAKDAHRGLAGLIAHAEHHCGPSCNRPHTTGAPSQARDEEVLDDATRAAVARTTGVDVGPVPIRRDPTLAGRGGEAVGGAIHLEPDLGGDRHGRKVRLHEAVHVAQTRLPGVVADRDLVEAEAAEVAHAAERGERQAPQLRADSGRAYGFELGDLLPDLSPVDLLRKFAPDVAHFVDQGLDGFMNQLGQGANKLFQDVLNGLGVDKFVDGFKSITAAVGPGTTTFGVLTGCCECLDHALDKLGGKLDSFLASDNAKKLQNAIGNAQDSDKKTMLDGASNFFEFLHKVGGPVLGVIEKAAAGIEWLKGKVGPLAQKVWGFICSKLGLDVSLPPLEAIKKKLGELWEKAAAALAPLRNAISSAVEWLKNASPLAPLFKLAGDIKKLVASVKKLIAAKTTDAKAWLATLAKDLAGTVFEPLLHALMTGRDALLGAANAVTSWFSNVLGKLGLLEAWRSSVAFLQSIVSTVQSFVGRIKAALVSLGAQVTQVLKEVADACKKFYDAVKPLLDFVCGFVVALVATASGNLLALPLFFLGNLWLHVLPDCYKDALVDFCLKQFIKVVQWLPARGMPIYSLVKTATLAFLNQLLATPRAQKMKAMDTIAKLFAGDVEFTLGLIVGIFKGLYDSTIGTVVFLFEAGAWLAQMAAEVAMFAGHSIPDILRGGGLVDFMSDAGESTEGVDGVERDLAGSKAAAGPAKQADEEGEEDTEAELGTDELPDDTPQEDSDPTNSGDEPAVLSGADDMAGDTSTGSDPTVDDGRIDPPPPIPADLLNGRALFDAVFKQGVTRKDLEELLNAFSTGLDPMAAKAGTEAAKKMIAALTRAGAAYDIGEAVGRIIGMVTAEVLIAVFTGGAGLAKTAVTLTKFAVKFAKSMPRLMKILKGLIGTVKPLLRALQRLKKGIGGWAGRVSKYVDDLIAWGEKNIQKLIRAIKARIRGEKSPGRPGEQPGHPRDGHPDEPNGKPNNKNKPGNKKNHDENLKVAAMRAAHAGWGRMSTLAGAVHQVSAVRARLGGTTVRHRRGIRVEVSLSSFGSGWKVKARASKGLRRATAKSGEGWITRAHENRSKWYAIKNEKRLHADILKDAKALLSRPDDKPIEGIDAAYERKVRQFRDLEHSQQQRITLRGVTFRIDPEALPKVESDFEISTELVVTPNSQEGAASIPLQVSYLGATVVQGTRELQGSFDSVPPWNWNGFPTGNIERHPLNDRLEIVSVTSFGQLQPKGDYRTVGGEKTPGNKSVRTELERWRSDLNDWATSETSALEGTVGPDGKVLGRGKARHLAEEMIAQVYVQKGYPYHPYDELLALGVNGWQCHHIHESSWGGPDVKTNLTYLPLHQHQQISAWFDERCRQIKKYFKL